MFSRFPTIATAVACTLGCAGAGAAGVDEMFSIRGFGTAGVLYTDLDQGDYVRDYYSQPEGVGRSGSFSADVDSKTALQLDARFTSRLSAVIQVVSESLHNNSWDDDPNKEWKPSLEWANLSYRVTDELTVRGGRIVMPLLMNAEFQKVGYANPWMHVPVEVYGKSIFTSVDGADMSYRQSIGSAYNTLRAYGGEQEFRSTRQVDAEMWGLVDTFELGALTLRAAYLYMEMTPKMTAGGTPGGSISSMMPLFAAYPSAMEVLSLLAESSAPGHKQKTDYYTIGASYDPGPWFVMSEVFKADGDGLSARFVSAYALGGVRMGQWTPHASYSLTDNKPFRGYLPTGVYGANMMAEVVARTLNEQIGAIGDVAQDQSTLSAGVRWDVTSNFAIKAQYDYIMVPNDSRGMFVNTVGPQEYEKGKDASVIGLSVDFVF